LRQSDLHQPDRRNGQHDNYYCGSRQRGQSCCLFQTTRRIALDAAIEELIIKCLLDRQWLQRIFDRLRNESRSTASAAERRKAQEKLAALQRQLENLIDLRIEEKITQKQFDARKPSLEAAIKKAEIAVPPEVVEPDYKILAAEIVCALREFETYPFTKKRKLLRRAVKSIVVSGSAIVKITLNSRFLHGEKTIGRSRWWLIPSCRVPKRQHRAE
jgi:hypothetical protein